MTLFGNRGFADIISEAVPGWGKPCHRDWSVALSERRSWAEKPGMLCEDRDVLTSDGAQEG